MLLLSVSSIYQERLWVQSERTARRMEAHTELSPSQTQAILAAFCCRTITTRGTAKSAPGPVAHPAAAWMPQPVRKYLTAVQRHLAPSARANGNCLRTTEMPSAGHNPSSTCSRDQLSAVQAICTYWDFRLLEREDLRPFFVHHMEKKAGQASSMPGVSFPLTSLPQLLCLFYMRLLLRLIILKITVWGCKAFLSPSHLCRRYLKCNHFAFRGLFLIVRFYIAQLTGPWSELEVIKTHL